MRALPALILGLAAATAACARLRPLANGFEHPLPPAHAERVDRLAIHAALIASPQPPQTSHDLLSAMGYMSSHMAALFDANHDGRYDYDEWLASTFAAYLVYNTAHDGRLLESEFLESRCGPDAQPYQTCGPLGFSQSRKAAEREFKKLDSGHKGYLIADDVRAEAMGYFWANDVNRDGYVTDQEITLTARRGRPR